MRVNTAKTVAGDVETVRRKKERRIGAPTGPTQSIAMLSSYSASRSVSRPSFRRPIHGGVTAMPPQGAAPREAAAGPQQLGLLGLDCGQQVFLTQWRVQ
jgi:hypothetical protein